MGGSSAEAAKPAPMWKQDESGRVQTPLEPVVLVATLALIPVLIIESDAKSEGWQRFAVVANWLIWAVFAIELAAILIVATRKRAALRAHWLDVAIVVLTVPLLTKAQSWLRLARFIRLARLGALATRALQAERRVTSGDSLSIAAILTVTAIVVAGAAENALLSGGVSVALRWDLVGGRDRDDSRLRRPLPGECSGSAGRDRPDVHGHWLPLAADRRRRLAVREARARRRTRRADRGASADRG
jgi:hypothetical protein